MSRPIRRATLRAPIHKKSRGIMDVYLDRNMEVGKHLPPGAPDFELRLDPHVYYVLDPSSASRWSAVQLQAAIYCSTTDVMTFVARRLKAEPAHWPSDRLASLAAPPAQLSPSLEDDTLQLRFNDLLQAPPQDLPALRVDPKCFDPSRTANETMGVREQARLRGLKWVPGQDGEDEAQSDPQAKPTFMAGVRCHQESVHVRLSPAVGISANGVEVPMQDLTPDTKLQALQLMSQRQAAMADLDALQALQPVLRVIGQGVSSQHLRASTALIVERFLEHRQRARQDLSNLLGELRQVDSSRP